MPKEDDAHLLYSALQEPLGYCVTTSDPEKLRQRLYKLRKSNPTFALLAFVVSPQHPESELWIVHKPESPDGI